MKLKSGMIVGALKNAVDRIYGSFLSGAFYRFLTGKGDWQKKTDSCAISCLPKDISEALDPILNPQTAGSAETRSEHDENGVMLGSRSARELPHTLRQRISGVFRESSVVSSADTLLKRAGNMRLRSLGIFLLMLGITSMVLESILFAVGVTGGTLADLLGHCLICVALIVVSLLLIGGGGRQLFDTIRESVLGSTVWYTVLGFRKTSRRSDTGISSGSEKDDLNALHVLPVFLGILLGVLSIWVTLTHILFAVCIFIMAAVTLYMPEAGLIVLLAAFPYVACIGNGYTALGICCLWIHFSWFIKYLNGKRNFRLRLEDLFFFLFALLWMAGGVISARKGGALLGISGMCIALLYFPAVNLLSSEEFVRKCIRAFLFGSLSVSVTGILRFLRRSVFFGGTGGFSETSVFASPDLLALYLGISLTLLIFTFGRQKRTSHRLAFFAVLIADTVCLFLTGSYLVIVSLLMALVIYCITASRKTIGRLLLLVPILLIIYAVLPTNVRELLTGLWNHTDKGVRYKFGIWQEALPTIRSYAFTGVGITKDAFMAAFLQRSSALAESEQIYNHYLQMILHIGIPGLLLFLTILLITLKKSMGTYAQTEKGSALHSLSAGAWVSALFLVFYGTGDYYWTHSTGFCLFFLILALNIAVSRIHGSYAEQKDDLLPEDIDLSADVSGMQEGLRSRKHPKKENGKNDQKPKGPEVTISDSE